MKLHPFWWLVAPEIVCPEGEQIVNGGFEDGLDDWDAGVNAYTTTIYKRSGNRSLGLTAYSDPNLAWVKQTLATSVPVECVDEFKLYCHADWNATEKQLKVTIGYTDTSTTEITLTFTATYTWVEKDLKSYLSAGKTVEYVKIETLSVMDINVDDVSLIGTG